ncbi:MAG: bifunctional hydroxymethylpyrimidine kinase/phosphomethylpyrimidine kinase [Gemmatimonadetes bacterium]|nr:bifunctional hydroxymethylpyrimidine kinase/phosphomethylpyrimidine kinase [Gemmatimonadota bacterium]
MTPIEPPIALTIAGSDSGGGAGIQADLKTFHAFGVHGVCAVTSVTAQNTRGVSAIAPVDPGVVLAQIDAVCRDLAPSATKTGMLATRAGIDATIEGIHAADLGTLVVDPVMVATSGDPLLEPDAARALVTEVLPLARLVTPNLSEATLIAEMPVATVDDMVSAARAIVTRGADAALVTGGHLPGEEAVDVLWTGHEERVWRRPRIDTTSTHGTGCTLSAAITAELAKGRPLVDAVEGALSFTRRAIAAAPGLGEGHGPLSHWVEPD